MTVSKVYTLTYSMHNSKPADVVGGWNWYEVTNAPMVFVDWSQAADVASSAVERFGCAPSDFVRFRDTIRADYRFLALEEQRSYTFTSADGLREMMISIGYIEDEADIEDDDDADADARDADDSGSGNSGSDDAQDTGDYDPGQYGHSDYEP